MQLESSTHFLSVYFFSIDPKHSADGSTSSPGYSVSGENSGLFKFWSLSRSFLIITSIPEAKYTLTTFQLTPIDNITKPNTKPTPMRHEKTDTTKHTTQYTHATTHSTTTQRKGGRNPGNPPGTNTKHDTP